MMKNKEDAIDLLVHCKNELSIASYDRIAGMIGERSLTDNNLSEESLLLLISIETNKSKHPELIEEVKKYLNETPKKDLQLKKKLAQSRAR